MLSQQLTLLLYDAKIQDDTATLLSLTQERRLKHNYSSNKTAQVQAKYSAEEAQIQNQISEVSKAQKEAYEEDGASDRNSELLTQYEELKGELNELKDKEERELSNIEAEATEYENENDVEQSEIQTDLEATQQDREAIKENLEQDIESTFGYFQ